MFSTSFHAFSNPFFTPLKRPKKLRYLTPKQKTIYDLKLYHRNKRTKLRAILKHNRTFDIYQIEIKKKFFLQFIFLFRLNKI